MLLKNIINYNLNTIVKSNHRKILSQLQADYQNGFYPFRNFNRNESIKNQNSTEIIKEINCLGF